MKIKIFKIIETKNYLQIYIFIINLKNKFNYLYF